MRFEALAHRQRDAAFLCFGERLDARRRRRGRRAEQLFEDVGAAQHRRRAVRIGRAHQERTLAEQSRGDRIGSCVTLRN